MMRWRIAGRTLGALTLIAVVAVVAGLATEAASDLDHWPGPLEAVKRHPWWFVAGLIPVTAILSFIGARWQTAAGGVLDEPLPPGVKPPESWVVERSDERETAVRALLRRRSTTVAITTALQGAGGFGKTTLAAVVCADPRIRRRFRKNVYSIVIGRDIRSPHAVAGRVKQLIRLITGVDPVLSDDPEEAGERLGQILDQRPRTLLVIDDVWSLDQLQPFLTGGGRRCRRLVTTRLQNALPGGVVPVVVDRMSLAQAKAVLTCDVPDLAPTVVDQLVRTTGRWPILLRLTNRYIVEQLRTGLTSEAAAAEIVETIRTAGPTAVDLAGPSSGTLDLDDPRQRRRAVRATVEAGTRLLTDASAERFAELAIFAEDDRVPRRVIELLWQTSAGLTPAASRQVCLRLADLSLITLHKDNGGAVSLHDVIRDFLRVEVGRSRLAELNALLVDAAAATLPGTASSAGPAWWQLDDDYWWDHLIAHLTAARRPAEAESTACDLRWVEERLRRFGPSAPLADLTLVDTDLAVAMRTAYARAAHLFGPTEPDHAVADILRSRLAQEPGWAPQIERSDPTTTRPRLVNRWLLPDAPDPSNRRTLSGFTGRNGPSIAIMRNGSLVTGETERARIVDPLTGAVRRILTGHSGRVFAVATSPDDRWIVTVDTEKVRVWDLAAGDGPRMISGCARTVSILPQSRLAVCYDHRVQIWDLDTWTVRDSFATNSRATALAHAPDGTWLAVLTDNGVQVRQSAAGRVTLPGARPGALALSPDSRSLYLAGNGQLRVWDRASGTMTSLPVTLGDVTAMAVAPDGSWLVVAERSGVRIWNLPRATLACTLTGHTGVVHSVAIAPDASWLATSSTDGTVRSWDRAAAFSGGAERDTGLVTSVAVTADGASVIAAGTSLRICDGERGTLRRSEQTPVRQVAVAPNGRWFAAGARSTDVAIRDLATGAVRRRLDVRADVLAFAPNSVWVATGSGSTVRVLDLNGADVVRILGEHLHPVHALTFARDDELLVTADDQAVRVWDVRSGRLIRTSPDFPGGVRAMTATPDGDRIMIRAGSAVTCWDRNTDTIAWSLAAASGRRGVLAASPDGIFVALGDGNALHVIRVADGRRVAMMRIDGTVDAVDWMPGHGGVVIGGSRGLYRYDFVTDDVLLPAASADAAVADVGGQR